MSAELNVVRCPLDFAESLGRIGKLSAMLTRSRRCEGGAVFFHDRQDLQTTGVIWEGRKYSIDSQVRRPALHTQFTQVTNDGLV